jgi:hypothetical protein
MSDESKVLITAVAVVILFIPVMVWLVRSAKRSGGGLMVAALLFSSFGRMFGAGAEMEHVETVKDPERKKRPGADGGPPPNA